MRERRQDGTICRRRRLPPLESSALSQTVLALPCAASNIAIAPVSFRTRIDGRLILLPLQGGIIVALT